MPQALPEVVRAFASARSDGSVAKMAVARVVAAVPAAVIVMMSAHPSKTPLHVERPPWMSVFRSTPSALPSVLAVRTGTWTGPEPFDVLVEKAARRGALHTWLRRPTAHANHHRASDPNPSRNHNHHRSHRHRWRRRRHRHRSQNNSRHGR